MNTVPQCGTHSARLQGAAVGAAGCAGGGEWLEPAPLCGAGAVGAQVSWNSAGAGNRERALAKHQHRGVHGLGGDTAREWVPQSLPAPKPLLQPQGSCQDLWGTEEPQVGVASGSFGAGFCPDGGN